MTAECSICLSPFKDPVSIPCGHIYCTKCLADHVNAPNNDGLTSTCPTCRKVFNTVTPDLTYLHKKYHPYVVPGVRRVYLDTSANVDLKKKLLKAESRIKKLERDQEVLLRQCEQYMAAANAHAVGESKAEKEIARLERHLKQKAVDFDGFERTLGSMEVHRDDLADKYQKLKRRFHYLENQFKAKNSAIASDPRPTPDFRDIFLQAREIRPLPLRAKEREASPPPVLNPPRQKRPRMSSPILD